MRSAQSAEVDIEDVEDQAADQCPNHAHAEIGPTAEALFLQRHQSAGQVSRHAANDQPDDELAKSQMHLCILLFQVSLLFGPIATLLILAAAKAASVYAERQDSHQRRRPARACLHAFSSHRTNP